MQFDERVIKLADTICQEVEKLYPGINEKKYEKGSDDWTFRDRVKMTLWFELLLAGEIK